MRTRLMDELIGGVEVARDTLLARISCHPRIESLVLHRAGREVLDRLDDEDTLHLANDYVAGMMAVVFLLYGSTFEDLPPELRRPTGTHKSS